MEPLRRGVEQCQGPVRAKIDEVDKDKGAGLGFRPPDRRKMRLRPLLRLLSWRLRRLSPRDLAADAGAAGATAAGAAVRCAARRVPPAAASSSPPRDSRLPKNAAREVAYSDLVAGLREGSVSAVAFEEDSRRVYFSKNAGDDDGSDASDDGENAGTATKWPYYARGCRTTRGSCWGLGLMREGGVEYRSSPRPAGRLLVDMLSTLLTLWVSLLPMMWFIQRQISAGGGAEKRRRPRKQRALFDDV